MSTEQVERVIVIGATSWTHEDYNLQITCIGWNTPFSSINLRDYDTWVMHVDSLPLIVSGSVLDCLTPKFVYSALLTGLKIYVLGDSRQDLQFVANSKPLRPFLDWTAYRFKWDFVTGTVFEKNTPLCREFYVEEYLSGFSKSAYALLEAAPGQQFFGQNPPTVQNYQPVLHWLLRTRYGSYPTFSLAFVTWGPHTSQTHGSIVFVPATVRDPQDVLRIFIRSLYDIDLGNDHRYGLSPLRFPTSSC